MIKAHSQNSKVVKQLSKALQDAVLPTVQHPKKILDRFKSLWEYIRTLA